MAFMRYSTKFDSFGASYVKVLIDLYCLRQKNECSFFINMLITIFANITEN